MTNGVVRPENRIHPGDSVPVSYTHLDVYKRQIHSSVKRWGNSPAVRIPATLMQALNLNIDDEVKIDLVDGKLIIEPVRKEPVFTLAELVNDITPENLHENIDWGEPKDKEVW